MAWKAILWGILFLALAGIGYVVSQPPETLPRWLSFVRKHYWITGLVLVVLTRFVELVKDHYDQPETIIVEKFVTVPATKTEGELHHPSGVPGELIKLIVGGNTMASAFPEMATEFFVARRDRFGRILVSTTLYDRENSVLAIVEDNKFKVNTNSEFKIDDSIPNEVKIQGKDLWLHLRLLEPGDTAILDGMFFYKGQRVIAGGGALRINGRTYEGNLTINGSDDNSELARKHWEAVERRERELRDASKRRTEEEQKSKQSKELP